MAEAQETVNQLQTELLSTLEVKAKLQEDQLAAFEEETAFLKKKADDYNNELRDLILKEQLEQKLGQNGEKGDDAPRPHKLQEGRPRAVHRPSHPALQAGLPEDHPFLSHGLVRILLDSPRIR